jgi:hypothetical protein
MIGPVIGIILAVIAALLIYFFIKKFVSLVINAIVGVIILFLLNVFHVMSIFGFHDLPISLTSVLICAIGGLPGVIIVIILTIIGVTLP